MHMRVIMSEEHVNVLTRWAAVNKYQTKQPHTYCTHNRPRWWLVSYDKPSVILNTIT